MPIRMSHFLCHCSHMSNSAGNPAAATGMLGLRDRRSPDRLHLVEWGARC